MAKSVSDSGIDLDLDVIQNVNWDPMEILHTQDGIVDKDLFKDKNDKADKGKGAGANDDDDDNKDDDDDNKVDDDNKDDKSGKGKTKQGAAKDKVVVDLTDEMIQGGLTKTRDKDKNGSSTSSGKNDDNADDAGDKGKGAKDKGKQIAMQETAFKTHYELMVESGEWQPFEGFDGSADAYQKAKEYNLQLQLDDQLDEYIADAFQNNPEGKIMGKKFLQHLANGGKVADFQLLNAPAELDFKALDDDTDEEKQKDTALEILTAYYRSLNWKPQQISNKLAMVKKLGNEVDEAQAIKEPFQDSIKAKKDAHETWLKTEKQKNTTAAKQLNTTLLNAINTGKSFGEIKIGTDKKSKEEYLNYYFQPNEQGQTQFHLDQQEFMRDPEFILFMGAAWKNQLHKNPDQAADKTKIKSGAAKALEDRLSAALLNKNIDDKDAIEPEGDTSGKNGKVKKPEFDLDSAVPIYVK